MNSGRRQQGFTYLSALALVVVLGTGLAAIGERWSQQRQRERERELAWIGGQFTQAIGLYYQRTPGVRKEYPRRLDELLEDPRFLTKQRYLRQIYRDPFSGTTDWILIPDPEGGIAGIQSPHLPGTQFRYLPPAAVPARP